MKRVWIRRTSVFLMILYIFLIMSGYTAADLIAKRTIKNNEFSMISIDISTRSTYSFEKREELFLDDNFMSYGFDIKSLRLVNDSDNDFSYVIKVDVKSLDEVLCDNLDVKVYNRDFVNIYSGSLSDLYIDSYISSRDKKDLIFDVELNTDDSNIENKQCNFDFNIKSYWNSPNEIGGIYAQRFVNNVINSGNW